MDISKLIHQNISTAKKKIVSNSLINKEEKSLGFFGYPDIYQTVFYLSQEAVDLYLTQQQLFYPKSCCLCSSTKTDHNFIFYRHGLLGLAKKNLPLKLPFCQNHTPKYYPELLVNILPLGSSVIKIQIASDYLPFLEELEKLNKVSKCQPPWSAFPNLGADSSAWRQGDTEHWYANAWTPYWNGLTEEKRNLLLKNSDVPKEWVNKLTNSKHFL